jgi:CRISPR/Cas system CSM-associated protein Csm3 (group 7 of RAMP superfamily)
MIAAEKTTQMKDAPFMVRHRITGTLTTVTPLHVGDGNVGDLWDRSKEKFTADSTAPSTIITDCKGKPCIPGSGLKGPLRALAKTWIPEHVNKLFGHEDADDPNATAGAAMISTAFHEAGKNAAATITVKTATLSTDLTHPYWNAKRRTAVDTHVSINRQTRTADDSKLYATEYVPPEEVFHWEIITEDLNDEEVAALLFLLENIQQTSIGAATSSGWGKMTWKRTQVEIFDQAQLNAWRKDPTQKIPWVSYTPTNAPQSHIKANTLSIHLAIAMQSPWLTRDARQKGRKEAEKDKDKKQEMPAAVPRRNHAGQPILPASSFRGSLRSQAERILRTVGLACSDHPEGETSLPSLAAHLFGHSDAMAAIRFTDLVPTTSATYTQEHVAIDRFTGGAAEGAKFTDEVVAATTLIGTLQVDLNKIKGSAALGLLAHLLRDLAEGEITLGSGSAKGRGFCTATITIAGHEPWHQHPAIQAGLTAFHQSLTPTTP